MATKQYPFTTPANYTYDTDKIEVSGGLAQLRREVTNIYAHYHLNESSGSNVPDSSSNSRDGTCVSMEDGDWVTGKLNNCLRFDGGSEYVNLGDIANFERTDAFSIEFWIKTTATGIAIISRMQLSPSVRGWAIFIVGTGKLGFRLASSVTPSNRIFLTASTVITNNAWHHVVVTYNGSSSASGVTIYVDNSEESLAIAVDTLTATIQVSIDCVLSSYGGISNFFIGDLDEVVFYDKELTQTEVTYRWNSGNGREDVQYYSDKPTIEPIDLFDPATVTGWNSFLETLGGGNQGSIGYNLYKVDKANKYYWNGSAWVTGGSSSNHNSQAIINTNIASFDASPDKIGFIAYLISDGEQSVELDEIQIVYTVNQSPSVNAGSDKSCYDHEIKLPFSDCNFLDPDGTVDHVYYDIEGSGWVEISQGGYGTLLEAVQAWTYIFNNIGDIVCKLKAEDNIGAINEDQMIMTVQKYTVTFNVKDSLGNHLPNIHFKPGDGTGYQIKHSPFTYEYEYNISGYDVVIDKDGYSIQTQNVPSTVHTENFTLVALIDTSVFASDLKRMLGLTHENFRLTSVAYDVTNNMTSCRIKIYPTANDCENDTDTLAEYDITCEYSDGRLINYKSKKV